MHNVYQKLFKISNRTLLHFFFYNLPLLPRKLPLLLINHCYFIQHCNPAVRDRFYSVLTICQTSVLKKKGGTYNNIRKCIIKALCYLLSSLTPGDFLSFSLTWLHSFLLIFIFPLASSSLLIKVHALNQRAFEQSQKQTPTNNMHKFISYSKSGWFILAKTCAANIGLFSALNTIPWYLIPFFPVMFYIYHKIFHRSGRLCG